MFLLYRIRQLISRYRFLFYRTFKYPIIRLRQQYSILSSYFRKAGLLRRRRGKTKKKRRAVARKRRRLGLKPKKPRRVPVRDRTATFDLAGRRVVLMVFASVVLTVLLFFGGFLSGVHWNQRAEAEASGVADGEAEGIAAADQETEPAGAGLAETAVAQELAESQASGGAVSAATGEAGAQAERLVGQLAVQTSFTIQVGSFLLGEDADLLVQTLTDRGYQPEVKKLREIGEKRVFLVNVGSYGTYPEAELAASTLAAREQMEAIAVRLRETDQG